MNYPHFLRIKRDEQAGAKHYVVHTADPKFSMELALDKDAPDRVGGGVIKRVCLPNSWAGDYGKYSHLMGSAQEFFSRSFAEPEAGDATQRFER